MTTTEERDDAIVLTREQLGEVGDEEMPLILHGLQLALAKSVEELAEALEGDEPLTDEKVQELDDVRHELQPVIEELAMRVPPEHRAG